MPERDLFDDLPSQRRRKGGGVGKRMVPEMSAEESRLKLEENAKEREVKTTFLRGFDEWSMRTEVQFEEWARLQALVNSGRSVYGDLEKVLEVSTEFQQAVMRMMLSAQAITHPDFVKQFESRCEQYWARLVGVGNRADYEHKRGLIAGTLGMAGAAEIVATAVAESTGMSQVSMELIEYDKELDKRGGTDLMVVVDGIRYLIQVKTTRVANFRGSEMVTMVDAGIDSLVVGGVLVGGDGLSRMREASKVYVNRGQECRMMVLAIPAFDQPGININTGMIVGRELRSGYLQKLNQLMGGKNE